MRIKGLFLSIVLCLNAFSASAETFFLVQLGSHASGSEAEAAWNTLRDKHSAVLSGLGYQSSEIILPPAGNRVYRLQAGPFDNRNRALETCGILQQSGQECFVVETTLFQPQAAAYTQAAQPPMAPAAEVVQATEAALTAESSETLIPLPEALPATPAMAAEMAGEAVVPAPASVPVAVPLREQPVAVSTPVTPSADMNLPWLKVTEENDAVMTVTPVEAPQPQEAVISEMAKMTPPALEIPAPALARPQVAPLPVQEPVSTPRAVPSEQSSPVIASDMPWNTDAAPQPIPQAQAQALPAPPPSAALTVPSLPQPAFTAADGGQVEVSEAIQVPLSENEPAVKTTSAPPLFTGPRAQGWGAKPSQDFMQKALWAQLSYFENEQAAMQYWDELRGKIPTIAKQIRVRISKPYQRRAGSGSVSLQLGPLLAVRDIEELCKAVTRKDLRCTAQTDMGSSATAGTPRYRPVERGYNARRLATMSRPYTGGYWVQLGSYRTRGEADNAWQELRPRHMELVNLQPHISQPPLSSSAQPVHRLRTGPYNTRYAAQYLCDQIKMRDGSCIVIRE